MAATARSTAPAASVASALAGPSHSPSPQPGGADGPGGDASLLGGHQAQNNPLARKLNKILNTRLEHDKDVLEALRGLSSFFTENTLKARRNLRGDIERRSLAINREFLDAFRLLNEELDTVHSHVSAMGECCREMASRLSVAREQTVDLIQQTNNMTAETKRIHIRTQVINAFLARFQLTPAEAQVIHGGDDIGREFFDALRRVRQIHADCKLLLRTNHQRAGLELMERMAMHLEAAYERLYRWAQRECRALGRDAPDVPPVLRNALAALSDRPVLYKYCLDELAQTRRIAVQRCFLDALARGGPGGLPRPIELHSHDPPRYVGDMLAWLHQAAASERELLEGLLGATTQAAAGQRSRAMSRQVSGSAVQGPAGALPSAGPEQGGEASPQQPQQPSNRASSASVSIIADDETSVPVMLDKIMEGGCRPFKMRVEQVINAETEIVVCCRVASLLHFYGDTIGVLTGPKSPLVATIEETKTLALKIFFDSLNLQTSRHVINMEAPSQDLLPQDSFKAVLALLRDVLACQDASLVPAEAARKQFVGILSATVDPLLQAVQLAASQLPRASAAVLTVNCMYALQTTLALYDFTAERVERLEEQIESMVDTLVHEQAAMILSKSGLSAKLQSLQSRDPTVPLSSVVGMDGASLRSAMAAFGAVVSSPDPPRLPQCDRLTSARLRTRIPKEAAGLVVAAYASLHAAISDPSNGYGDPQSIVFRPPEQVRLLIGS